MRVRDDNLSNTLTPNRRKKKMNTNTNTNINILATFTDSWDDEVRIVEIDGTIYEERDGERQPIQIDCHQGGIEKFPMNRENVKEISYEVGEDSTRNFCSVVCMPSECFKSDLESDYDEDVVEAITSFFKAELDAADAAVREELKPNEKEGIELDFELFLDNDYEDSYSGNAPDDDETKVADYLEEVQNFRRKFIPAFHDDDEVLEICRNYLKK